MERRVRWLVAAPLIAGTYLAGCQRASEAPHKVAPSHVEHIEGQEVSRLTLTSRAAERLDIKTAAVQDMRAARSATIRKGVSYAAVLYDAKGNTWVYTNPDSLTFVRQRIVVDYIEGDMAVLSDGPPAGTRVVIVGAAELFGAEFEIGH